MPNNKVSLTRRLLQQRPVIVEVLRLARVALEVFFHHR